ncbi:MAG: glycosyltransferase [Proteobacteria bacterium]|nr:glycosyltransferase [Pseudomonadota bacterium]
MKKNYPLISVIIPVFNRENFIKESMLSVINQTFKNIELIVYDDASNDNTEKTIKKIMQIYEKFNILYLKGEKNRGPSFARNRGVEIAKGEYIAFLDSDDLWLKNKLSIQIKEMIKNNWDICQTDELWIRNGIRVNPHKKHKKISGYIFEKALKLCIVSPSAVMMKKNFFLQFGGFDETLPACEDYDLWLRISSKYPIFLIDKKLVIKRGGHQDQLSKTIKCLDKYRIYSIEKLLKTNNLSKEQKILALSELKQKCYIYIKGLQKRGFLDESNKLKELCKFYETQIYT